MRTKRPRLACPSCDSVNNPTTHTTRGARVQTLNPKPNTQALPCLHVFSPPDHTDLVWHCPSCESVNPTPTTTPQKRGGVKRPKTHHCTTGGCGATIYDAGLPHPPSPPTPWYPPLPVKWVVVLFGVVAFPVWSCLASSPPPPCGVGPAVFLVGPAPLVAGQCVLQTYGMVATAC